jgi:FtsP/CotA-like multicopper oxidase with cupredoxin domain
VTAIKTLILLICLCALPCFATTRHYYIAAEDVTWNYAPSGQDLMMGSPIPMPWRAKTSWTKTRFIEYTDASFTVRKPQPVWLGILGPIIRAEVGDEILVDFFNRSHEQHNMHPHGLRYDKNDEGGYYLPVGRGGSHVPPGVHFIYHWFADEGSGPGPGQLSSVVWWYHAHIDEEAETNAGLMGPIVITAKGHARPDGSPKDVDQEFVASFMIFDEMGGKADGLFYAINGYIFGNLPGLMMKKGDKVRWYLLGMGSEQDLHTPHWHGKTVTDGRRNLDVVELLPGSMATVDMIADNPGTWMFHCHVADHMESGMMAVYTIYVPQSRPCPIQFTSADFWNSSRKNSLTLKNNSGKNIKSITLTFDHLLTAQDRHRPFNNDWTATAPVPAGHEETLERLGYFPAIAQQVTGWILFPSAIQYEDGTKWRPEQQDECFQIFWRDKEHPELPALPPVQIEMKED